ncbi:hypothetical protein DFH27DRAFT_615934 [Peziza echinospora]|nr:hypothetical protein DFH27DRAFT_615934 [Peziza echinospora]
MNPFILEDIEMSGPEDGHHEKNSPLFFDGSSEMDSEDERFIDDAPMPQGASPTTRAPSASSSSASSSTGRKHKHTEEAENDVKNEDEDVVLTASSRKRHQGRIQGRYTSASLSPMLASSRPSPTSRGQRQPLGDIDINAVSNTEAPERPSPTPETGTPTPAPIESLNDLLPGGDIIGKPKTHDDPKKPFVIRMRYGYKEEHTDGGKHFHIMLDLGLDKSGNPPKISGKRAHTTWDIKVGEKIYHPNIAGARKVNQCWHYINKCNEPAHPKHGPGVIFGNMADQCLTKTGHLRASKWSHIVDAKTDEEFFQRAETLDPRQTVCSYLNLKAFATRKYATTKKKEEWKKKTWYGKRKRARRYDVIQDWIDIFLKNEDKEDKRLMPLWIIGKTQIGKSAFVEGLGPHYKVEGEINAATFDDTAPFIFMDDVVPKKIPSWYKAFFQGRPFSLTGKYVRVRDFQGGVTCIVATNYDLRDDGSNELDMEWIYENVVFVDLERNNLMLNDKEDDVLHVLDKRRLPPKFIKLRNEVHSKRNAAERIVQAWKAGNRRSAGKKERAKMRADMVKAVGVISRRWMETSTFNRLREV